MPCLINYQQQTLIVISMKQIFILFALLLTTSGFCVIKITPSSLSTSRSLEVVSDFADTISNPIIYRKIYGSKPVSYETSKLSTRDKDEVVNESNVLVNQNNSMYYSLILNHNTNKYDTIYATKLSELKTKIKEEENKNLKKSDEEIYMIGLLGVFLVVFIFALFSTPKI